MSSKETAEAILLVIKKIGKWILLASLFLISIFLVLLAYSKIETHYQNRPKVVGSLKGIALGERFQDFMFRNSGFAIDVDANKKVDDTPYYRNKEKSITVKVDDDKVVRVLYACVEKYDSTEVNGIDCGSLGDKILENYGKEIQVQCLKQKSDESYLKYRVYDSIKYGIRYHVVSNEVIAFDISSPAELDNLEGFMRKNWTACE